MHTMPNRYATLDAVDRDQLKQLAHDAVWDGDLISKYARDRIVDWGLAQRYGEGMNALTQTGITVAEIMGYPVAQPMEDQ